MNDRKQKAIGLALLMGAWAASGTQYWWSGNGTTLGGDGTWDTTAARWGTSVSGPFNLTWPNGGGDEAVFSNAVGTVTLDGTVNLRALSFQTNHWTITGGVLDFGSGDGVITAINVPMDWSVIIDSPLKGSGTLTFTGQAKSEKHGILLRGNNSAFTGKIIVRQTAKFFDVWGTNDNAFGAVPVAYVPDAITLANGGAIGNYLQSGTVSIPANRGITVQSGTCNLYNRDNNSIFVINSPIAGKGDKLQCRGGTFILHATNTFTGQFVVDAVDGNATIQAAAPNVFAHGPSADSLYVVRWNWGLSVLDLNGYSQTLPGLCWAGNGNATGRIIDNLADDAVTLTIGDNNKDQPFDGCIRNTAGALSLTKVGTGTQTLTGTNAYSGATTISGGTLVADLGKSNGTDVRTNVLPSASSLVLAGGALTVKGATTGASRQTLGDLYVAGYGLITVTPNGGTGTTLALGDTWARETGGTLLADLSASGATLSSNPALTNGIIGGYAFVKDGTGIGFATVSGGSIVRYTGATVLDAAAAAADLQADVNYTVASNQRLTGPSATQTLHSVVVTVKDPALHLDTKTLVVGAGGILFTSTSWSSINSTWGSKITSDTDDLVINVTGSGGATLSSSLVDNGTRRVGLTKTGSDVLYLGRPNSYSGDTVINQGRIILAANASILIPSGAGKGNLIINAAGELSMDGRACTVNGLSDSDAIGGYIKNTYGGPTTLTVGAGDADGAFAGSIIDSGTNTIRLVKIGTGTQILSGTGSNYHGGLILSNGVLSVNNVSAIGGATGRVDFAGGTLRITGTSLANLNGNAVNWGTFNGGLEIADAAAAFTITNSLPSGTVLAKTGAGTLVLAGQQAGTVNTDDSSLIALAGGISFYNLGILVGGTLSPGGSGAIGTLAVRNNLALAGTYVADVAADGSCDAVTVAGDLSLAQGAALQLADASRLNRDKTYTLLTAAKISGTLTASPALPENWKLSTAGGKVVLSYSKPGTLIRLLGNQ